MIKNNKNLLSLYVHWPYCETKCPYCDFNSHVNEMIDTNQWIKAFKNQLYFMKEQIGKNNIDNTKLETIFFGGGTPSLMPPKIIETILCESEKIFGLIDNVEITLEANPNSCTKQRLINLQRIGINRLSVGVQSLNYKSLKFLGRDHSIKDVTNVLDYAPNLFKNISVDLIYAFHNQKLKDWSNELENFLNEYQLQHISLYQLTIEEGTKFFNDHKKGKIKSINTDLAAELYDISNKILNHFKFDRYEISNYARKGFRCKHNLNYWNSENWIGIGPGAYGRLWSNNFKESHFKHNRIEYQNFRNPRTWLTKNLYKPEFEKINFLEEKIADMDTLMMGLRLSEGIKISKLSNKFIINFNALKELQNRNYLIVQADTVKINTNHILKLNSIINFLTNP